MGEVYKARDSRLGREVAIKVLPADVASHAMRLKRFEREAQSASALNHPNIVTVYDTGLTDGLSWIAMERVEGKTLREVLVPGPLAFKKLVPIATQIAEGLAAAHAAGIVHRDLKPENLMVTREGRVKILDFGLAKLKDAADSDSQGATETQTTPGMVVGTVGYMSPEQAQGQPSDFRSDQFSFGSILYEMATGRRAFRKATSAETLVAILREDPLPFETTGPPLPLPFLWILGRCLEKSPEDRYGSTQDLARDLARLGETSAERLAAGPGMQPIARHSRRAILVGAAAAIGGAALGGLLARRWTSGSAVAAPPHFQRLTFRRGTVLRAKFVPNSDSILYTASWEGESPRSYVTLAQSSGLDRPLESEPQFPLAFSQDGGQVLVLLRPSRALHTPMGTLAWWPILGGSPRMVLADSSWADWAARGRFFAVVRNRGGERTLEIVGEGGETRRTIFRTSGSMTDVRISRDERRVAFVHHPSPFDSAGFVELVGVETSDPQRLTPRFAICMGLDWKGGGEELLFTASQEGMTESGVWSVAPGASPKALYALPGPFVLQDLAPDGRTFLLTSREETTTTLVRHAGGEVRDASWFDWSLVSDVSPDGNQLLMWSRGSTKGMSGVWMRSLAPGATAIRIGDGSLGRFSPDGKLVVALTDPQEGPWQVVLYSAGPGPTRVLTRSDTGHWAPAFAGADTILFVRSQGERNEIWRMASDGSGARRVEAVDCDAPESDPSARQFVCLEGRLPSVFPTAGGPGRKLRVPDPEDPYLYARFDETGSKIYGVTSSRKVMTFDAASGRVVREERLFLPEPTRTDLLSTVAFNATRSLEAASLVQRSAALFLARNLA